MRFARKGPRERSKTMLKTRGKCAAVRCTELKGGKVAPPGDGGVCERESNSQGRE